MSHTHCQGFVCVCVREGETGKNGQLNISVVADVCLCLDRDEGAKIHERGMCVCLCQHWVKSDRK